MVSWDRLRAGAGLPMPDESVCIMGIVINHEARRRDILQKSLRLFAEQGYNDVTFQKIADRCGIARTTLYTYFGHKREIFDYTISLSTVELAEKYAEISSEPLPAPEKIIKLLEHVLRVIFRHRVLLTVILDYVLSVQRTGHSMRKPINRHTIGLKSVLRRLLKQGMAAGELTPKPVGVATALLYGIMESAILRITISENATYDELQAMLHHTMSGLRAAPPQSLSGDPRPMQPFSCSQPLSGSKSESGSQSTKKAGIRPRS